MRRIFLLLSTLTVLSCSAEAPKPSTQQAPIVSTLRRAFVIPRAPVQSGIAVLPTVASRALRVAVDANTWIELTPRGAHDVAATTDEGATVYADAFDGADLVYVEDRDRVEELRLARTRDAAAKLVWDVRPGPSIAFVRVKDGRFEAIDRHGAARIVSEPAFAVDHEGVRRPLSVRVDGSTLSATLDTTGLALPIAIDPAWTSAGSPTVVHAMGAIAKLSTGKILVAGGAPPMNPGSNVAELYDPATNTWTTSRSTMAYLRNEMLSVAYAGGAKVLLMGGESSAATTSEIYDAASDTFTTVSSPMPRDIRGATVTLLKDGRIVAFGGAISGSSLATTPMIFDPGTGVWTNPSLSPSSAAWSGRVSHTATQLASGKLYLVGGQSLGSGGITRFDRQVYRWDPVTNTLERVADMPSRREKHHAYALSSGPNAGKLFIFGGAIPSLDETSTYPSAGSFLYDESTNTWTMGPFMTTQRTYFASSEVTGGRILASGGVASLAIPTITAIDNADLYDPLANVWLSAGKMSGPRGAHLQETLAGGGALIVSGITSIVEGSFEITASAERFSFQANAAACLADGQCTSGHCVDGVCCNTACTGQCAACDVSGKVGTCSAVTGAPHGKRTACDSTGTGGACALSCDGTDTAACHFPGTSATCSADGCTGGVETHASTCDGAGACKDAAKSCGDFVCGATACKTACESKADCVNPNHFCEAGKCIPFLSNGIPCTRDDACASGLCVDGTCCESKCDGQCQACDVPGQAGRCTAIKGKPHGARAACPADSASACGSKVCDGVNVTACTETPNCGTYGCDTTTLVCKSTCAANTDCGTGFECKDAACVPQSSKCSADSTQVIGTDGTTTNCAPYACREGQCLRKCNLSTDCLGGSVCDGSGACVTPTPQEDPGGGCTYGGRSEHGVGLLLAIGAALSVARRRR
jgi:N-acetylneuraminic acid mutarotase